MAYPQNAVIGGRELKDAFSAACQRLEQHRDALNALNVFPVPDGDTGTNMLLTLRAAVENAAGSPDGGEAAVSGVASQVAEGAFWGARGNSGVILSQFLAGFCDALKAVEECTAADLARAFQMGKQSAYQAVGNPVEGTMLTVLGAVFPSIEQLAQQDDATPVGLWEVGFDAALTALESTPELLPVLKEVGVVDAGGLGIVVILGGALDQLTGGDRLDSLVERFESAAPAPQALAGLQQSGGSEGGDHAAWGNCIQFLIQGEGLDPEAIRQRYAAMESLSAVVAGNEKVVRLHVHAADPEPFLAYGRSLGELHRISIEDMDQQNSDFIRDAGARTAETPEIAPEIAIVAVVSGDGLDGLFRDTGCSAVVSGGQTMNPSVQQLLDSADATRANSVILLPNNGNIVAVAQQAASRDPRLHVVPSRSIPQGIAALLAFNSISSLEDNLEGMGRAIAEVTSVEVTTAVRDTTVNGFAVRQGQRLALTNGEIVAADDSPEKALLGALRQIGLASGSLVTLYLGEEANRSDAEEMAAQLEQETPEIQVDLIFGGQPHYHYLASVE